MSEKSFGLSPPDRAPRAEPLHEAPGFALRGVSPKGRGHRLRPEGRQPEGTRPNPAGPSAGAPPPLQGLSAILETAWQRYATFDANASAASRRYTRLRWWAIVLGLLATLLAILSDNYAQALPPLAGRALHIGLISVPIVSSVVLAFANKFQVGERWLALRAAAEELKKDIEMPDGIPREVGRMVQEVQRAGGIVEHINTTKFDYWQATA